MNRLRLPLVASLLASAVSLSAGEPPRPFPDMAISVGQILAQAYYDQRAFKPEHLRVMVTQGLRALEETDTAIETTWRGDQIAVLIAPASAPSLVKAAPPTSLDEAMEILEKVRAVVGTSAFTDIHKRELDYAMLNGALRSLDPHSLILPPEVAQEFTEDIQGEFFGIGAILREDEGTVLIERVLPGLPAERTGVEDGDAIVAVDGEKTAGLSLGQVVRRIKGARGTTVRLTIDRKNRPGPFVLPIVRNLVTPVTERAVRLGDVGYVRMDEFHAVTGRNLAKELGKLQEQGPLAALVLDLRYNGGGLLDQARLVADFFLEGGKEIVRTVAAGQDPTKLMSTANELVTAPVVVLVSSGTASASEIVSGALQLQGRAIIVGSATFGKGSVQSIKTLRDESRLKLTIQEYQLPGGVSIQRIGVSPDLHLIGRSVGEDGTVDLMPFTGRREADDEFALSDHGTYREKTTFELPWVEAFENKDLIRKHAIAARDFIPDQEATLVIQLLQEAASSPDWATAVATAHADGKLRSMLLDRLRGPVAKRAEAEQATLAAALAKAPDPVAWGEASVVKPGDLVVRYDGPKELIPGETAELKFVVENRGSATAGRVWGLIDADRRSALWEDEVVIGTVPAGGSATGRLRFSVPPRMTGGTATAPIEERFSLALKTDGDDRELARLAVGLNVAQRPMPHLSFSWKIEGIPDQGLGLDQEGALRLTVINDGDAPTGPSVDVAVFKDNDPFVVIGSSRLRTAGPIPAGGHETMPPVSLRVRPSYKRADGVEQRFTGDNVTLQVRMFERLDEDAVRDRRGRADLFHVLSIPVREIVRGGMLLQPRLEPVRIVRKPGNVVDLTVLVTDDDPEVVALFQNRDKIDLRPSSRLEGDGKRLPGPAGPDLPKAELRQLRYTTTLTLQPGLNELRVVATDASKMSEYLNLRLWGEGVAQTAKAVKPGPAAAEVVP